jgi:ribonuclease T2
MCVLRNSSIRIREALILLALSAALIAQFSRRSAAAAAAFDYYVLSLSWAPAFCAKPGEASRNPGECASGQGIGFVVHGLWPQAAAGKSPESCGNAGPVPKAVVNFALQYMPSAGLIQHEWTVHGSCTGLAPFDYFRSIAQTRSSVQIPVQLTSLTDEVHESAGQIESQFSAANPSFPTTAFRTSCPGGDFAEERVCFDKGLKPRACTTGVGECVIQSVTIRAPR